MTEAEVETIIQRARERFPDTRPRSSRQRTAVHRQGFQGIYSDLRHDSRENVTILSSCQWKDGEVVQDPERRLYPSQDTALSLDDARRIVAEFVALQRSPFCNCRDRLCRPCGQVGRPRAGDLHRAGSQAGCRERKETSCSWREPGRSLVLTEEVIARNVPLRYDDGWPGRRIGPRGDTTRAPIQGPRPKGGGRTPPCRLSIG